MSGGHWEYEDARISSRIHNIANDAFVLQRFPALSVVLRSLGKTIVDIAHDMDWDFSGDSQIENDKEFEKEAIKKLGACLKLKLKIKVYEIEEPEK